jgi:hypothetical protein
MMTGRVRAVCSTCGPIEVRAVDITIIANQLTAKNTYRFCCPHCYTSTVQDAGPTSVMLLLRAGATLTPSHSSGPITLVELIAFHEELRRLPAAET